MTYEILLGLTTTPNSDWREKVEEIKKFGIKKIALFPTFLKIDHRKELYSLLDQIKDLQIPHVHLRENDMEKWEMEWFEKKGAEVYNIHGFRRSENPAMKPYIHKIFVENHPFSSIPHENILPFEGLCLDFQHWEFAYKLRPGVAKRTNSYAHEFKIGCCHVSPFPKLKNSLLRLIKKVGGHYLITIDEVNYLLKYKQYLPKYISLEMENTFERQLEVKQHLEKILVC